MASTLHKVLNLTGSGPGDWTTWSAAEASVNAIDCVSLDVPLTSGAIAATTLGQTVRGSILSGNEATGYGTVLHTGVIA